MLVNELIQMLCDDTDNLIDTLRDKLKLLIQERSKVELSIVNLNKVLRIAIDVRARKLRNEKEIGELHAALDQVSQNDGELDLTNLYMWGRDVVPDSEDEGY